MKPSRIEPNTDLFGDGSPGDGLWMPRGPRDTLYMTENIHLIAGVQVPLYTLTLTLSHTS